MGNKMETTIVYWGYIRIMGNKMETATVYWGYTRTMEKDGVNFFGLIRCCQHFLFANRRAAVLGGHDFVQNPPGVAARVYQIWIASGLCPSTKP